MTKQEVLELRDRILDEWSSCVISAYSGMPADPDPTNKWYKDMTKLAEEIGGDK